jgi:hypothetical protein
MSFKRWLAIGRIAIINVVIALCLLEITLRVQQKIGPIYDLDFHSDAIMQGLSDELNHVHPTSPDWDADGIRRMNEPNPPHCSAKLLFMGDSFMEGPGTDDTVPVHVKRFFRQTMSRDLCVFNAGCSTYAPSIFVPQAKKLIPKLMPDLVLIDVDETDIYDDYFRYRQLVTRDGSGSIVAVRRTPIIDYFQHGLLESVNKRLYLHRFLAKLHFTKIDYPAAFARYFQDKPRDMLWLARLPAAEVRSRYGPAIEHFESTLEDLTSTVVTRLVGADKLIYLHHPHLQHLRASGGFNDIVSATIRKVASRNGVQYYDATDDLKAAFREEPGKYYIPDDVHFNALGQRAYGLAIAKYLAKELLH